MIKLDPEIGKDQPFPLPDDAPPPVVALHAEAVKLKEWINAPQNRSVDSRQVLRWLVDEVTRLRIEVEKLKEKPK